VPPAISGPPVSREANGVDLPKINATGRTLCCLPNPQFMLLSMGVAPTWPTKLAYLSGATRIDCNWAPSKPIWEMAKFRSSALL